MIKQSVTQSIHALFTFDEAKCIAPYVLYLIKSAANAGINIYSEKRASLVLGITPSQSKNGFAYLEENGYIIRTRTDLGDGRTKTTVLTITEKGEELFNSYDYDTPLTIELIEKLSNKDTANA